MITTLHKPLEWRVGTWELVRGQGGCRDTGAVTWGGGHSGKSDGVGDKGAVWWGGGYRWAVRWGRGHKYSQVEDIGAVRSDRGHRSQVKSGGVWDTGGQ